jgi:hypothetical protein
MKRGCLGERPAVVMSPAARAWRARSSASGREPDSTTSTPAARAEPKRRHLLEHGRCVDQHHVEVTGDFGEMLRAAPASPSASLAPRPPRSRPDPRTCAARTSAPDVAAHDLTEAEAGIEPKAPRIHRRCQFSSTSKGRRANFAQQLRDATPPWSCLRPVKLVKITDSKRFSRTAVARNDAMRRSSPACDSRLDRRRTRLPYPGPLPAPVSAGWRLRPARRWRSRASAE